MIACESQVSMLAGMQKWYSLETRHNLVIKA